MVDPARRTAEWRESRKERGYVHLDLWIKEADKHLLAMLAAQRSQELHEVLTAALAALAATAGPTAGVFSWGQVEALIKKKLAEDRASPQPVRPVRPLPQARVQVESQQHTDPLPPATEDMRQCRKGHDPYPQAKAECPTCVRDRKQKSRAHKAELESGETFAL